MDSLNVGDILVKKRGKGKPRFMGEANPLSIQGATRSLACSEMPVLDCRSGCHGFSASRLSASFIAMNPRLVAPSSERANSGTRIPENVSP